MKGAPSRLQVPLKTFIHQSLPSGRSGPRPRQGLFMGIFDVVISNSIALAPV